MQKVGKERYILEKVIKPTLFGDLWKGKDLQKNIPVAIKVSVIKNIDEGKTVKDNIAVFENPRHEVDIFKKINNRCPYIVDFIDSYEDDKFHYIVYEYLSGGTLFDHYMKYRRRGLQVPPENDIKIIFQQILAAVAFLHMNNIVHQDISPENILFDDTGKVRLIDFGSAMTLSRNQKIIIHKKYVIGRRVGCSPENYNQLGVGFNGYANDVYNLGILLYCLLHGTAPYKKPTKDDPEFVNIINGKNNYLIVTRSAASLLKIMLTYEKTRCNISDIIRNNWINSINY